MRFSPRFCPTKTLVAAMLVCASVLLNSTQAQESATAPNKSGVQMSSQYIPDDALAVLLFSPHELFHNPYFSMFPLEVIQAQALDKAAIDPEHLTVVKVVVGAFGPQGPTLGIVAEFNEDVTINKLLEAIKADPTPIKVGQYSCYQLAGQPELVLTQKDARTIVAATPTYLDSIIKANNGTGQLAQLVSKISPQSGFTLITALESVRPMLSGLAMQQVSRLPPPLHPLGRIPGFADALLVNFNASVGQPNLRISLLCVDENGAQQVESILNDSLRFGREISIAQAQAGLADSDESPAVKEATLKYANRIADTIQAEIHPQRTGRRVELSIGSGSGVMTTGIAVGLLLPAIQAARESARRMSASNNLKQILLAMHNYHSAKGHLPPPAIVDANGKPLLSWRVALLPYLDQQELYSKFHLDEPWDSPNNLPLAQFLPAVYSDPSAPLSPGFTVFHAVVGEEVGLKPNGTTDFTDITDGTSNTILVFEANRNFAVPWSMPEDVSIDVENPLARVGNTHQGGFHAAFADGAVRFISINIDPQQWRALLTRSGGERVQPF